MKKLIGTVAVAALLASAAFAEVSFGAWLNNTTAPVAGDGDDIVAGVNNPWGGLRSARIGISYLSDDEKVGMNIGMAYNEGAFGFFGNNHFYVRPWDWLKVSVGGFDDNDTGLRSDLCLPSWGWLRPQNAIRWGEGITFSDIAGNGFRLQLFPVDGLQVALLVPYSSTFTAVEDVYRQAKIGAGYTIGDIGAIKVQWHGKSTDKKAAKAAGFYYDDDPIASDDIFDPSKWLDDDGEIFVPDFTKLTYDDGTGKGSGGVLNTFEVAFDLTAIDGMFLTVGGAFDIAEDSDNNEYTISLGWSYNLTDAFTLLLDASARFYGDSDEDPMFGAAVGVNFGFTDSLSLDAELRYLHTGEDADSISFLVGLNYNLSSNGLLGIGFQGNYKGINEDGYSLAGLKAADDFVWAVPIRASIWF